MNNLLITGGTGTLGKALLDKAISSKKFDSITVASRDENKQAMMAKKYPDVSFMLMDIRDKISLARTTHVFHCAAYKHVDIGEREISKFIDVNLVGTINLVNSAMLAGVKTFSFFSTDKAVLPINAYGMTKALSEKFIYSTQKNTHYKCMISNVYRWGNIVGSRGSVIPYFAACMVNGDEIPVTDMRMTRFWLQINDAADFVFETFESAHEIQPLICPKIKAASIVNVIDAISYVTGLPYKIREVGIRPGEKLHECLKSDHGSCLRSDTCEQYTMDELIELVRPSVLGN
jgi:UDP-N-acetylglucosamine 4,6-dehydratase